jgi:hypothetical protein
MAREHRKVDMIMMRSPDVYEKSLVRKRLQKNGVENAQEQSRK